MKLLLHHPFRDSEDVAVVAGDGTRNYIETYKLCQQLHEHPDDNMEDPVLDGGGDENTVDSDEFEDREPGDPDLYQSFEALAGRTRNEYGIEVEDPNNLGDRDIDRDYDWSSHCGLYPDLNEKDFWDSAREMPRARQFLQTGSPDTLQTGQRLVFDAVVQHYQRVLSGKDSS